MFKFSFKQQVITGFVVSLIFVMVSAISTYLSIKSAEEDAAWENHTQDVINHATLINLQLTNAESSMRGFLITEKPSYIQPYNVSIDLVSPNLRELKSIVADNPSQIKNVDSLEHYVNKKLNIMKETLAAHQSGNREAALALVRTNKGESYMDDVDRLCDQIIQAENDLLVQREKATKKSGERVIIIVLGSALINFCLFLLLFYYIKRTFEEQKNKEIEISNSNIRLGILSEENKQKNRLLSGLAAINEVMRGEHELEELSTRVIKEICSFLAVPVGVFFLADKKNQLLKQSGSYAYQQKQPKEYYFGEGMVGQAALEMQTKLITTVGEEDLRIRTALVQMPPKYIYLCPVVFEGKTIAVIELGLNAAPDEATIAYLETIEESIAVAINSTNARIRLQLLFEHTQQQAEELESQQEELRTTNEELMYKTDQLQASEEELRVQQEELRQSNAELEEKNLSINEANEAISLKAEELASTNQYKSEFLANMSHELRTPLNSILILARILKDNKPDNLNEEQVKYAGVIHSAGSDLLTLINDILDLSKIESGKIDLQIETVRPAEIKQDMESLFSEIARSKKIAFDVQLANDLPEKLLTDLSRIEQIIKNLLSNAFKFTPEQGEITLGISRAKAAQTFFTDKLKEASDIIAIEVKDSGIGIPEEKQKLIFEAFQQADGSTSRKYGGTGLGLSISKELAHILGGEIHVESSTATGSIFTLFIPAAFHQPVEVAEKRKEIPLVMPTTRKEADLPADKNGKVLLIVEDDVVFAEVLKDYALEKGFQPLLAHQGDHALEMAMEKLPDAIILDIMLPVMDGWAVLKKLKTNVRTQHIPVHMMSAGDERKDRAQHEGAISFLKKPIAKEQLDDTFDSILGQHYTYNFKTVLLIEDQELQSKLVKEELVSKDIEVEQAFSGAQAMELLQTRTFDCIILDLNLPDISGFDLLDKIKAQPAFANIPVVINTAMELDQEKMSHIMKHSEAMVLKSMKSNNRLIDEVSLFMNKLKKEDRTVSPQLKSTNNNHALTVEKAFQDKTVLIADDDMRNIFALSSALQDYNLNIVVASNGREAIEKLENSTTIDLVLMDIMMPEMDGYEAMRAIRLNKEFVKLPIIALTAKAMKNDREKCIAAGANDYISKPVEIDKLLSMMRVWLS